VSLFQKKFENECRMCSLCTYIDIECIRGRLPCSKRNLRRSAECVLYVRIYVYRMYSWVAALCLCSKRNLRMSAECVLYVRIYIFRMYSWGAMLCLCSKRNLRMSAKCIVG